MENFIHTWTMPEYVCDNLLEYFKIASDEYRHIGSVGNTGIVDFAVKQSTDLLFYNHSTHPAIVDYFNHLQNGYEGYVNRFGIDHFNLVTEQTNLIQFYPPGGGYKVWHYERDNGDASRQLVYMTYLNTVSSGGTEWYYQDFKLEAVKGLSVIWPADFTHLHRGIVSSEQEKIIATGWFKFVS